MVMHNMLVLSVKRSCGRKVDVNGDGADFRLTVTKLIDIKTGLYVCYNSGISSEKEAFDNAIKMLNL